MQRPRLALMIASVVFSLCAGLMTGLWTGTTLSERLGSTAWATEAPAAAQPTAENPSPAALPQTDPAPVSQEASSAPQVQASTAPAPASPNAQTPQAQVKIYTVQIASFKDLRRAGMLAADLRTKGLEAEILSTRARDSGKIWYAVRAGEYTTQAQARELARTAQTLTGAPTLVRRLSRAFLARNTVPPAQELTQGSAQGSTQEPALAAPAAKTAPLAAPRPTAAAPTQVKPKISAKPQVQTQAKTQEAPPTAPAAPMDRLARAGVEVVLGRGRTKVEPATPNAAQPSDWVYAVQAAGFNEPGQALELTRTLADQGLDTSIAYMHGWYVVQAGAFAEHSQAKARADIVRAATGREPTIHASSRRTLARSLWTPENAAPGDENVPAPAAATSPSASLDTSPGKAPSQRELMVRVENWGRPDLSGTALVASYRDPREAGGMARRLKDEGVPALVVYAAGPEPWAVYKRAANP